MDLDIGLACLVCDLEGEVLDIGLHFDIGEFAANEALGIEHTARMISMSIERHDDTDGSSRVLRVHGDLILRGVTDETFGIREGDIRGGGSVTLVVGDDLNAIILPDTDTAV